jgi:hypothetical protein
VILKRRALTWGSFTCSHRNTGSIILCLGGCKVATVRPVDLLRQHQVYLDCKEVHLGSCRSGLPVHFRLGFYRSSRCCYNISVSEVTGYGLDDSGSVPDRRVIFTELSGHSYLMGNGDQIVASRTGHSPTSSAKVYSAWGFTSTSFHEVAIRLWESEIAR